MSMMNTIINGDGGGGGAAAAATSARGTGSKRVPGMPLISGRNKDRDHEDLILFRELHKRQKERNILSLLQPVSDEFEPTGIYILIIYLPLLSSYSNNIIIINCLLHLNFLSTLNLFLHLILTQYISSIVCLIYLL